ncbi:hypothetical protein [Adlercreutzia sp. ZJ473]|uniref:coiled-coil domain-containing protein n=1 Tax=Adlercreutzia sp. ZJ473 TaxID=2722822 RepID=UPI0015544689|nr:hypothetical protein [Adlercreutzia sp. ZJ473]
MAEAASKAASRAGRRGRALAAGLALALALVAPGLAAAPARAVEVDDAKAAVSDAEGVLSSAQAQMDQIAAEHDALSSEVAELQRRIDASAAEVLSAQEAMLAGRAALGQTVSYGYRTDMASALFTLLLEAESFDELLRSMDYLAQVAEYQADAVAEQRERKERFESLSGKLSAQKDEQEQALAQLEEKRAEAERVVAEASARLAGAQSAYSAQLAALQAQAEAFAQQAASGGAEIAEDANTVDRVDVVPAGTPVQPDPAPSGGAGGSDSGGAGGSGSGGSDASPAAGWLVGVASAYGGSSDPYTPNPGITATGAVCDDSSMGVAVPMSMPNYRSYFGRAVEISYNGMTVYAVVNDCGGMGGGSRVLDLQPGVFKAFGYGDCYAWGLRTVKYRFL